MNIRSSNLLRGSLALLGLAACAPVDGAGDPTGSDTQELRGQSIANATCSDSQRALLNASARYARFATASPAFVSCVQGAVLGPGAARVGRYSIGPYVRCTGDQNYDQPRATQAARAIAAASGNNNVVYGCDSTLGIGATGQTGAWNHTADEGLAFTPGTLDGVIASLPNPVCRNDGTDAPACRMAPAPWPHTTYANTFLHEVMHTHGYVHGINDITEDPSGAGRSACGVAASVAFDFQVNTMPYLVGNCGEAVIQTSFETCGQLENNPACRPDQLRMITSLTGSCGCVDDPHMDRLSGPMGALYASSGGVYATENGTNNLMRYDLPTRRWSVIGGPGRAFAVNDVGVFGVSADGAHVLRWSSGTTWTTIGGGSSRLVAGGSALYSISPSDGSIWRYNNTPNSWTQVGGAGAQFVANQDGLYALSVDRRNVLRFDGSRWTVIGGAARSLWVGPHALYASAPDGTFVTRFANGSWAAIATSSTDLMAGGGEIVDTGTSVYMRRGPQVFRQDAVAGRADRWDLYDANAIALAAHGDRLVLRRLAGEIYRAVTP